MKIMRPNYYENNGTFINKDGFDISARYAASLNPVTRQWTADMGSTTIDTFWLSDASFTTDGTSNPLSSTGIRVYENGILLFSKI